MVSYSSLNGVKCHASRALVTGLLKEELGHARLREITRDAPRLGLLKEELGFRGVVGSEERSARPSFLLLHSLRSSSGVVVSDYSAVHPRSPEITRDYPRSGVVVSDYNAVQQCGDSYSAAVCKVVNAGVDIVMTAGGRATRPRHVLLSLSLFVHRRSPATPADRACRPGVPPDMSTTRPSGFLAT